MRWARTTSAWAAAIVLSAAVQARADDATDEVVLASGGRITGRVLRSETGVLVVIRTASGATEILPWSEVARVSLAPGHTGNPAAAPAAEPPPEPEAPPVPLFAPGHWELGARAGVEFPLGKFAGAESFPPFLNQSDQISRGYGLTIEGGHRFASGAYVGAYAGYAILSVPTTGQSYCVDPISNCGGHHARLGVAAEKQWALRTMKPWAGFGFGYESVTLTGSTIVGDTSISFHGLEYLHVDGGVLFPAADRIDVGPYAQLTLGQYGGASTELAGTSTDVTLTSRMHEWLTVGVRATYALP